MQDHLDEVEDRLAAAAAAGAATDCPRGLRLLRPRAGAALGDEAYYVQKGVGWTLRECFNLYPDDTLDFLRQRAGEIDPRAFSAAIEKLSPQQKTEIKTLRKAARGRHMLDSIR